MTARAGDFPERPPRLTIRITLGVAAAWVTIGAVWAAQTALGSTVRGGPPVALATALRTTMVQTLPWIPATIAAIALTIRFPLAGGLWRRNAAVHLLAATLLAFMTNALVVLGYWIGAGQFGSVATLIRQGALWATLRFHFALLIYASILAMTQGVLSYRRARARELHVAVLEGQLARARLQALNAQIRPHFLFNTLHTIGQLWRSGRSDDAEAVLDHLGSLFHKVQRLTAELQVPLADELEMVREYLAIEQARFRDRLTTSVHASDEALGRLVPPLILQPIVENAVRHGISAASSAGEVEVSAVVDEGRLRLTVRDDGPGVDSRPPSPGSGTGLRNTRERLTQLYGEGARLDITSAAARGTVVTIDIPLEHRL